MGRISVDYATHPEDGDGPNLRVTLTHNDHTGGSRTFRLESSASQREGAPQQRDFADAPGQLRAVTGSPLFDALLSQALDDARLNAVSSISDGAYLHGAKIPCECFQTGEKWTYVWTRDISYATHLGMALVDARRAANSLLYKVSAFRKSVTPPADLPPDSLQIVQDTGSGGSWPVSTDRVSWSLGAESLIDILPDDEAAAFAATALAALKGTLEADRRAVFDPADGLYRGEQSFLDWRTQTYAPHVADDLTEIATSKALSTNVCHLMAQRLAARLAREAGETVLAERYAGWAAELAEAIAERFWLADHGLLASLTTPDSPAVPVAKFDMLGIALAILGGVVSPARARAMLAHYPQAPYGPPVYFPQQPDVFVYHNRAIWAFVTAYALEAAAAVGAVAAADHAFLSLSRAAALYLDNVENQEWLTGRTWFDDGPAISSRRQLWSIGGYVGMVAKVIFGFRPGPRLAIRPFLTGAMRRALGDGPARLEGLVWRGRRLTVRLDLPPVPEGNGHYPVSGIRLNGQPLQGDIDATMLAADNLIEVDFGPFEGSLDQLTLITDVAPTSHDDPRAFSPREPVITDLVIDKGRVRLNFEGQPPRSGASAPLSFTVLRDGLIAASGLTDLQWFDPLPLEDGVRRSYRVAAVFTDSGNASHVSRPAIIDTGATQTHGLDGPNVRRGDDGSVTIDGLEIAREGTYAVDITYANHLFHIQTGVTNAVKRLILRDGAGRVVAEGIVQMPHMTPVVRAGRSTSVAARLLPGRHSLIIADYFNMSYLAVNETYISPGGMGGSINQADMRAINLTRIG